MANEKVETRMRSLIEQLVRQQTNTVIVQIVQTTHNEFCMKDDQGMWFKVEVSYVRG